MALLARSGFAVASAHDHTHEEHGERDDDHVEGAQELAVDEEAVDGDAQGVVHHVLQQRLALHVLLKLPAQALAKHKAHQRRVRSASVGEGREERERRRESPSQLLLRSNAFPRKPSGARDGGREERERGGRRG